MRIYEVKSCVFPHFGRSYRRWMTPPRWKLFTPLVDGQMAFKAPCLVNQVKPKSALSYAGAIPLAALSGLRPIRTPGDLRDPLALARHAAASRAPRPSGCPSV